MHVAFNGQYLNDNIGIDHLATIPGSGQIGGCTSFQPAVTRQSPGSSKKSKTVTKTVGADGVTQYVTVGDCKYECVADSSPQAARLRRQMKRTGNRLQSGTYEVTVSQQYSQRDAITLITISAILLILLGTVLVLMVSMKNNRT